MATRDPMKDLREELACPICLAYFKDPVILSECGHNFCRACLTWCWKRRGKKEMLCPQCRGRVEGRQLIPNRQLANVVGIAEKLGCQKGTKRPRVEGEERDCPKHKEPLKLFCKTHGVLVCVVCDRSEEHKTHKEVPLEEAFQEYKAQIKSQLEPLKKERESILAWKANIEQESQELLKQTEADKGKSVAAFRQLQQFLEEQEKLVLAQVREAEEEIARKKEEHLVRLSGKLSAVEALIRDVEEKRRQPASELLQDIENFLKRCEKKERFEDPVAFSPALKWKIWDSCDISAFLEGLVKQFKDALTSALPLQKAAVTLNPGSVHPALILSEDRRSISGGGGLGASPKRSDYYYVLGCERFTKGRHFWEVQVGTGGNWDLGVTRKAVGQEGDIVSVPKETTWVFRKGARRYWACQPPDVHGLPLTATPKRIRVSLNCEGGRLAFYDADTAALLYVFPPAAFSGETLFPLFFVFKSAHLTLCP